MRFKGINYDVGTSYLDETTRRVWRTDHVERDVTIIRDGLRCNAVAVYGDDLDRLAECAAIAREAGLAVWLQPRIPGRRTQESVLGRLATVAGTAEELRERYGEIYLNVGCELSVFAPGVIPGRDFTKRLTVLSAAWWLMPVFNHRLNTLLGKTVSVARSRFNGPVTYGAGLWEKVDWRPFDFVGVNYYRYSGNRSGFAKGVRALHAHGKPVIITEFGCCSYAGAEHKGPNGYDIIDWETRTVKSGFSRDEGVQARYLRESLGVYADEGVAGTFAFEFSSPLSPYSTDPRRDLDMASFSVVRVPGEGAEEWVPKASFQEIADFYGSRP
ncbi:hypothetical protein [Rhizohabitans arisaemae]|uniref:hypothetical protein n=1 Tax=Rhizohabitans arisaemae TaxID=2720610 RepID=UPI0024B05D5D|nr:hypothetical protein [Rhizohabitans arisaemae]